MKYNRHVAADEYALVLLEHELSMLKREVVRLFDKPFAPPLPGRVAVDKHATASLPELALLIAIEQSSLISRRFHGRMRPYALTMRQYQDILIS